MLFAHAAGHGESFGFNSLEKFVSPLLVLQNVACVRTIWAEIIGTQMTGFSPTRWWSRWEIFKSLALACGEPIDLFVQALRDQEIGEESSRKLHEVLSNAEQRSEMELELALCMELEPLVKVTYELEGDGLTALVAYDKVEALRLIGRNLHNNLIARNRPFQTQLPC